jgi:pyrimidine-nucleoside phosphorylase
LIAASVMSKKLAVSTDLILLDVKAGSGAFMRTTEDARELAQACLALAAGGDRVAAAAVTDMSQPLGEAVGNALDVAEAVEILRGGRTRLRELVVWFVGRALEMLEGVAFDAACAQAEGVLDDGSALERFRLMVEAQGGDGRVVDDPTGILPRAPLVVPLVADRTGTLAAFAADEIGMASGALGAGRIRKGDAIDPSVGIVVHPKIGDHIVAGETIGEIHARTHTDAERAGSRTLAAFRLVDGAVEPPPLVHEWLRGA